MYRIGSRIYKLLYLDTNAIREITTDNLGAFNGFLQKFIENNGAYAPCISIYIIVEIWSKESLFRKFLDVFSNIPCFMFFPIQSILSEEYKADQANQIFNFCGEVAHAFVPNSIDSNYNIRLFLNNLRVSEVAPAIEKRIQELKSTAEIWQEQRKVSVQLTEKNYHQYEPYMLKKDLDNFGYTGSINNYENFPSLRVMEYSHFNRVHLQNSPITANDVMDVEISYITPYMDAVITEKYQADVLRKAKMFIPQLKSLEIYRLKDIRIHATD